MLQDIVFDEEVWKSKYPSKVHNLFRMLKSVDEWNREEVVFQMLDDNNDEWVSLHCFIRIQEGVYWANLNSDGYLNDLFSCEKVIGFLYQYAKKKELAWNDERIWNMKEFYGVGDSPEQILTHPDIIKQFVESEEKFVLCCTPIIKSHQPETGGWRWHKWGEYIGNYNPQHEYLYDEDNIEEVVVYHFYMIP